MSYIDFSEVYHMFYKKLYQIGYSITRDIYLAEDVVQETFLKAMKKIETIKEKSKIGAWLSAIATRTAIDFIRKEKNKKWVTVEEEMLELLGQDVKQSVEEEVETGYLVDQINCAIGKLTHEYQDVLLLKVNRGLKTQEIATVLNLNPCTVKTRIHRARQQLKILFYEQVGA